MAATFPDGFYWSPERRQTTPIVFRIEAEFANHSRSTPGFDCHQNLSSRGSKVFSTEEAARLHLTWAKNPPMERVSFESPFISLFTSYRSAMWRKDWFIEEGATRVNILAYDVSQMKALLDARHLASHLGLKRLYLHKNELLAVAKIAADDYTLLAAMSVTSSCEVGLSTSRGAITLPKEYWDEQCYSRDPLEALRLEVYCHTGWRLDRRLQLLISALKRYGG